jgi:hypothetical protein
MPRTESRNDVFAILLLIRNVLYSYLTSETEVILRVPIPLYSDIELMLQIRP